MTIRTAALAMLLTAGLPAAGAAAQSKPAPRPTDTAATVVDERTARETRERLREVLDQYPPSVAQVLRLDPSLLNKTDYMAPYPALAAYVAQHPEIAHNPAFFLGEARLGGADNARVKAMDMLESVFIGLEVLIGVVSGTWAIAWLLRSVIDQRRWQRAMKIQTDAHAKIVDRLASNEDLLTYMQSPAGQRFLSSSPAVPAMLEAAAHTMRAPFNRILWSVQAGVVVATGGVGLWFAKNGVIDEAAQPMQVVAILAMALGVGFILSAIASYALSRQLGLVESRAPDA